MKIYIILFIGFIIHQSAAAQKICDNIIIVTTDGFRWQELFMGADSTIMFNPSYVADTSLMRQFYWADSEEERRKKLMPFTWNFISQNGQIWGNRKYNNDVSIENPYRLSYAGYNEILTGYTDLSIITNKPRNNRNENVLYFLNKIPEFIGKVAMFGSWKLFANIVRGKSSGITLNAGHRPFDEQYISETIDAVNEVQAFSEDRHLPTRSDLLTFTMATEFMRMKHPKVVHIGFGETDEYAHHAAYDMYLNQANMFDKMLSDLWTIIQRDEFYRNKTMLFITTDHGRGNKSSTWMKHGTFIKGSDETWMMQMGPGIEALGEVKHQNLIRHTQFARAIAGYLGYRFTAPHPVAESFVVSTE